MNLSELLAYVGDANVKVQRVDSNIIGARVVKGGTELKIITNAISVDEVFALTDGKPPRMHGLIVWIPRDLLPPQGQPAEKLSL